MSVVDKLKALIEPQPEVSPEQSWPNAQEPEYWEDDSVNNYTLPPVVTEPWAPTDDKQMPGYRGVESHGVPFDSSTQYVIPLPQDVADANEAAEIAAAEQAAVHVTEEHIIEPIPVTVVEMPSPIGRENRVATTQFPLDGVNTIQIAPKSRDRSRLALRVIDPANAVFISTNKQNASVNGYPIVAGTGDFDLDTTSAVYAFAPVATTIYVLTTWSIEVDEEIV